jgi:ABC-2 type transport system ATP-binding protein
MKQRLGIAIALSGNPDIVLMDEPINGLDPQGIIEIREIILDINKQKGTTFIISSHLLDELSKIATDYAFIDHGRIIKEISAKELIEGSGKSYSATVSDASKVCKVLDDEGKRYKLISDKKIRIEDEMTLAGMSDIAGRCGVELIEFTEHDTSLEGYFINLVEG